MIIAYTKRWEVDFILGNYSERNCGAVIGTVMFTLLVLFTVKLNVFAETNASDTEINTKTSNESTDFTINKTETSELSNYIPTSLADKLGYDVNESYKCNLVFGDELSSYGVILKVDTEESTVQSYEDNVSAINGLDISGNMIVDLREQSSQADVIDDRIENNEEAVEKLADVIEQNEKELEFKKKYGNSKANYTLVDQTDALQSIDNPDESYMGAIVTLTPEDRDLLERLVFGEAGDDYFAACLVAQTIRDTMVYAGEGSVADVRAHYAYSGSINKGTTENVKRACAFIFDEGGIAVKHQMRYFYAYKRVKSSWHESQVFVIEYGGHRYFARK